MRSDGHPSVISCGQRKVIGMVLGFGSYNYVFYLLLTWLPSYLSSALHIDLLHSFLYTGVPWLIATVADLAVGGWLVDALIERGWNANSVRRNVLIGGTACGLGILGAANTHSAMAALIWISISIGGLSAASAVGWSIPSLIAPRSSVGRVGGNHQFFKSGFRHLRADHHWLSGCCPAIVCLGIRRVGDLPLDWHRGLYLSAGQDRADAG